MECLSCCVANSIDLSYLYHHFNTERTDYVFSRLRDVFKFSPSESSNVLVFVFKNGTVVTWGLKRHQLSKYIDLIKPFANNLISIPVHDEFSYRYGERTSIAPHRYFDVDCLSISVEDEELKLSLSYGFSQSVKLQYFETILEGLIDKYDPFIQRLSNSGEMDVSRKQIRQIIGEILGAKSEMNLISNFLYHPQYFWQHPTLEENYILLERYLHVSRRVNTINHRLDTLNEIFDMFSGYLENRHSHSLEIIIIALIGIEILFGLLNLHF